MSPNRPPQPRAASFKSLYRKRANTPCSCLRLARPRFRYNTRTSGPNNFRLACHPSVIGGKCRSSVGFLEANYPFQIPRATRAGTNHISYGKRLALASRVHSLPLGQQVVRSYQSRLPSELVDQLLFETRHWQPASLAQQHDITLIVTDVI